MNDPLVSIIIPVYNAGNYLAETIISALDQTWPNKEIIVIDNGSTDNSVEIARAFGNKIKLYHENKKGASAARNKGLTKAKGDYIQFLDADDLLKNDKIELQLNAIKNIPGVVAYGSFVNFFNKNDIKQLPIGYYLDKDYADGVMMLYDMYAGYDIKIAGGMIPQHSWLTPRQVIDAAGNWNIALSVNDDGEFFCRVALNSSGVKYVSDSVCYYRKHKKGQNLSAQLTKKAFRSRMTALNLNYNYLLEAINNVEVVNDLLLASYWDLGVSAYPKHKTVSTFCIKKAITNGYIQPKHQGSKIRIFLSKILGWRTVRIVTYLRHEI